MITRPIRFHGNSIVFCVGTSLTFITLSSRSETNSRICFQYFYIVTLKPYYYHRGIWRIQLNPQTPFKCNVSVLYSTDSTNHENGDQIWKRRRQDSGERTQQVTGNEKVK